MYSADVALPLGWAKYRALPGPRCEDKDGSSAMVARHGSGQCAVLSRTRTFAMPSYGWLRVKCSQAAQVRKRSQVLCLGWFFVGLVMCSPFLEPQFLEERWCRAEVNLRWLFRI